MKVATAQLAGDGRNADRVFVTDNAVIVLDGASAHEPVDLNPGDYAQALGEIIADQLDQDPAIPIADAVATAIRTVTQRFNLIPGRSPSSTVAVLRVRDAAADLYVLGDSPIHYGTDTTTTRYLLDDRMSEIGAAERREYATALRAGHGFDEQHHQLLSKLQRVERGQRNQEHGYWIAEADGKAARHALTASLRPDAITWAVLATDGASDVLEYLCYDWAVIAGQGGGELRALLAQLHQWEDEVDPTARQLPRSKPHDDKTVAAIADVWN